MKNIRISKRLLSLLTAGILMGTPVLANASNVEEDNNVNTTIEDVNDDYEVLDDSEYMLYSQIEHFYDVDSELYDELVQIMEEDLSKYINVDRQKLQCLAYVILREFMTRENARLIEQIHVHDTTVANGIEQNLYDSYSVIAVLDDYYQSTLHKMAGYVALERVEYESYNRTVLIKYFKKIIQNKKYNLIDALRDYNKEIEKKEPENVIITDKVCAKEDERLIPFLTKFINEEDYELMDMIRDYDAAIIEDVFNRLPDLDVELYADRDIEIARNAKVNIVNAYRSVYDGTLLTENPAYIDLFGMLTTLNAEEKKDNAKELSGGGYFYLENVLGYATYNMQSDYLMENFTMEELKVYFEYESILSKKWVVRSDAPLEDNCSKNEIESIIYDMSQLKRFIAETVNNDLLRALKGECETSMGSK